MFTSKEVEISIYEQDGSNVLKVDLIKPTLFMNTKIACEKIKECFELMDKEKKEFYFVIDVLNSTIPLPLLYGFGRTMNKVSHLYDKWCFGIVLLLNSKVLTKTIDIIFTICEKPSSMLYTATMPKLSRDIFNKK